MDRMLYVSMTGAKAMMSKQDRIAQNLANVNTPGYKSVSSQTLAVHTNGDHLNSRAYAIETSDSTNKEAGPMIKTDNSFNMAINGEGFFTVYDGKQEAYTRNGNFKLDTNGMLVNDKGYPVISQSGTISLPIGNSIDVAKDGSVYSIGSNGTTTLVDQLKIVDASVATRGENGLFYVSDNNVRQVENPDISSGYLESSNVNASTELVNMISASRLFDMQMKGIQFAKENDEAANKILQL